MNKAGRPLSIQDIHTNMLPGTCATGPCQAPANASADCEATHQLGSLRDVPSVFADVFIFWGVLNVSLRHLHPSTLHSSTLAQESTLHLFEPLRRRAAAAAAFMRPWPRPAGLFLANPPGAGQPAWHTSTPTTTRSASPEPLRAAARLARVRLRVSERNKNKKCIFVFMYVCLYI